MFLFAIANHTRVSGGRSRRAGRLRYQFASTPPNALAAGGTTSSSLRNLKHYRGKQLIEEVDAYDLLLHGVGSDLKRLENGDFLVLPIGGQATVSGMARVRRLRIARRKFICRSA
jgi:hypothetical protein